MTNDTPSGVHIMEGWNTI